MKDDSKNTGNEFGRIKKSLKIVFPRTTSADTSDTNILAWALIDTLEALSLSVAGEPPNTTGNELDEILEPVFKLGYDHSDEDYETLKRQLTKYIEQQVLIGRIEEAKLFNRYFDDNYAFKGFVEQRLAELTQEEEK